MCAIAKEKLFIVSNFGSMTTLPESDLLSPSTVHLSKHIWSDGQDFLYKSPVTSVNGFGSLHKPTRPYKYPHYKSLECSRSSRVSSRRPTKASWWASSRLFSIDALQTLDLRSNPNPNPCCFDDRRGRAREASASAGTRPTLSASAAVVVAFISRRAAALLVATHPHASANVI